MPNGFSDLVQVSNPTDRVAATIETRFPPILPGPLKVRYASAYPALRARSAGEGTDPPASSPPAGRGRSTPSTSRRPQIRERTCGRSPSRPAWPEWGYLGRTRCESDHLLESVIRFVLIVDRYLVLIADRLAVAASVRAVAGCTESTAKHEHVSIGMETTLTYVTP
jgi:hypothetical protein